MPTKHSSFESHLPNQSEVSPSPPSKPAPSPKQPAGEGGGGRSGTRITAEHSSPAARPRITSPKTADGNGGTGHNGFDSRQLLHALLAARNGDFSMRLPADWAGVEGK